MYKQKGISVSKRANITHLNLEIIKKIGQIMWNFVPDAWIHVKHDSFKNKLKQEKDRYTMDPGDWVCQSYFDNLSISK